MTMKTFQVAQALGPGRVGRTPHACPAQGATHGFAGAVGVAARRAAVVLVEQLEPLRLACTAPPPNRACKAVRPSDQGEDARIFDFRREIPL